MLEEFKKEKKDRAVFLSSKGAFVIEDDRMVQVDGSIARYLHYDVFLDDKFTLHDLFELLSHRSNIDLFSDILSVHGFKDYVALWRITTPYQRDKILVDICIGYVCSYSKGESYEDKKRKDKITGESTGGAFEEFQVNFADEELEKAVLQWEEEDNKEILSRLADGTYEQFMSENQHVSSILKVYANGWDSEFEVGSAGEHRHLINYSLVGAKMSEIIDLPIRFDEYILCNEDVPYEDEQRIITFSNKPDVNLFNFVQAIFDELSWTNPHDRRESNAILKSL